MDVVKESGLYQKVFSRKVIMTKIVTKKLSQRNKWAYQN